MLCPIPESFHQTNGSSLTSSALLFFSAFFSSRRPFSAKLLSTWSFICHNWINIVDGTNIVNLPEEWGRLNSILADNTKGKSTRRLCYFAESPPVWRGYWPWQKGDAEFCPHYWQSAPSVQEWSVSAAALSLAYLVHYRGTSEESPSTLSPPILKNRFRMSRSFCQNRVHGDCTDGLCATCLLCHCNCYYDCHLSCF